MGCRSHCSPAARCSFSKRSIPRASGKLARLCCGEPPRRRWLMWPEPKLRNGRNADRDLRRAHGPAGRRPRRSADRGVRAERAGAGGRRRAGGGAEDRLQGGRPPCRSRQGAAIAASREARRRGRQGSAPGRGHSRRIAARGAPPAGRVDRRASARLHHGECRRRPLQCRAADRSGAGAAVAARSRRLGREPARTPDRALSQDFRSGSPSSSPTAGGARGGAARSASRSAPPGCRRSWTCAASPICSDTSCA